MVHEINKKDVYSNLKYVHWLPELMKIKNGEIVPPANLQIDLTNICNHDCDFCYYHVHELGNFIYKHTLPTDKVLATLDDMVVMGGKSVEYSLKGDELIPVTNSEGFIELKEIRDVVNDKDSTGFTIDKRDKTHKHAEITAHIKHPQYEPLFKITLEDGRNVTVTKSHSVYFYEEGVIQKKPVKEAKIGDLVVVGTEVLPHTISEIDKDWARFLGYYTAEGNLSFQRTGIPQGINLTFDIYNKEKDYIEDVRNILVTLGYNVHIDRHINKTSIRVHNKQLCEKFLSYGFKRKANQKQVPSIILNAPREAQLEFLKGLFCGDGNFRSTIDRGNSYRNSLHLKTSSRHLQLGVSFLLNQLRIRHTLSDGMNKERKIEGRTLQPGKYYCVNIYSLEELKKVEFIIKAMGKELKYRNSVFSHTGRKKEYVKIAKDIIGIPIKKIEEVKELEDEVYDISVSDTHSFITSLRIMCSNTGGGEPLVHKDYDKISQHARQLGLEQSLVTNGQLINRHLQEVTDYAWVRFSINGGSKTYASTHRVKPEMFKRVQNNLEALAKVKKDTNMLGVSHVVTPTNWVDIYEVAQLAKNLGADNYRISLSHTDDGDKPFIPIWGQILDEIDKAKELQTKDFRVFAFSNRIADIGRKTEGGFCFYHHLTTALGADGELYPCCYFKYLPQFALGNIKEQSFTDVWFGDKRKAFIDSTAKDCAGACWMQEKNKLATYLTADKDKIPHVNYP